MSANSASEGTVYSAPDTPRTAPASRGRRCASIASGTASSVPRSTACTVSPTCCPSAVGDVAPVVADVAPREPRVAGRFGDGRPGPRALARRVTARTLPAAAPDVDGPGRSPARRRGQVRVAVVRVGHHDRARAARHPLRAGAQAVRRRDARRRGARPRGARARAARARRAVRLRQVDHAADGEPARRADVRARARRGRRHRRRRPGRAAPADGLRHPERGPLPAPHRRAERRDRPAPAGLGRRPDPRAGRASCSSWSASRPAPTRGGTRTSCPAASGSASGSPVRSRPTRRCCSWTSRSGRSTRSAAAGCRPSSAGSGASSARRSCS